MLMTDVQVLEMAVGCMAWWEEDTPYWKDSGRFCSNWTWGSVDGDGNHGTAASDTVSLLFTAMAKAKTMGHVRV
jgi:hypothetical protein